MRVPVGARAMRLPAGYKAHGEVARARQRADRGGEGASGHAGDLAKQAAAVPAIRTEPLGDGEDDLPVRDRREPRRDQPRRPDRESLGVAARAAVPARAREREEVLVGAIVTPDARDAELEHAAGNALVRDLPDHGASRAILAREALVVHRVQAVHVILHQPEHRRRLRTSGCVDAEGRRRLVPHARSLRREQASGPRFRH